MPDDIVFGDAPTRPTPRDLANVDCVLVGHTSRYRVDRRLQAAVSTGYRSGPGRSRRLLSRFGRRSRACRSIGGGSRGRRRAAIHERQNLADADRIAFLFEDLGQRSILLYRNFDIDLVRFELDDRLARGDSITFLLEPLADRGVDD
jgi:hypothetical protein